MKKNSKYIIHDMQGIEKRKDEELLEIFLRNGGKITGKGIILPFNLGSKACVARQAIKEMVKRKSGKVLLDNTMRREQIKDTLHIVDKSVAIQLQAM